MGTRHTIFVIKDNNVKVAQYGQWDGGLKVNGDTVLTFCKEYLSDEAGRDVFGRQVDKCKSVDNSYVALVNELLDRLRQEQPTYAMPVSMFSPMLSRNTGADILKMIYNFEAYGDDSIPIHVDVDTSYSEYVYVIDLDNKELRMYTTHADHSKAIKVKNESNAFSVAHMGCFFKHKLNSKLPTTHRLAMKLRKEQILEERELRGV